MDSILFFKKFLRYGTRIASAVPSSRWLAKRAIADIDWNKARVVVELGAGTGAITQYLIELLPKTCTLISFESDDDFVKILNKKYGGREHVHIVHGNACKFDVVLAALGFTHVDYIVSGLGVPTLSNDNQRFLFAAVQKMLAPGGSYSQITEIPLWYLSYYRRRFEYVRFFLVPLNIPPGGVYLCKKPHLTMSG